MNGRLLKSLAMAALGAVSLFGNTLVTISNITSPNGTNAPYQATVDGVANVTVICDDYYDLYSSPFTATVLFLSQLNSSDYKRTLYGRDAGSLATATSLYDEVAYLALQFSSNPMTNWAGIQIALWNIFDAAVGTQSPAPTGTPPQLPAVQATRLRPLTGSRKLEKPRTSRSGQPMPAGSKS
jgi:hypothetical protein